MVTKMSAPMVAGVDSARMTWEFQQSCLRETEMQEAVAISNQRRRDEWIAGRIAAKYVFLCATGAGECAETGALDFRMLSTADLSALGSEAYRSVAITRSQAVGGGRARAGWSHGSDTVQVAISHSSGIACASLGTTGVHSLDIETPASRVPEFYLQTYTQRERDWVGSCVHAYGIHSDWLYTLLWSTRECLLKTPRFAAMSLWNMPLLDIEISGGVERLAGIYNASEQSGHFVFLQAGTFHGPFHLGVSGGPKLILTAVTEVN